MMDKEQGKAKRVIWVNEYKYPDGESWFGRAFTEEKYTDVLAVDGRVSVFARTHRIELDD